MGPGSGWRRLRLIRDRNIAEAITYNDGESFKYFAVSQFDMLTISPILFLSSSPFAAAALCVCFLLLGIIRLIILRYCVSLSMLSFFAL